MLRSRHAKIVATVGPASNNPETLAALVEAGVDVFRLNFSHGSADDHRKVAQMIRDIEKTTGRPLAILQDLPGPKIRIGEFEEARPYLLAKGDSFRLDSDKVAGTQSRVYMPHPEILAVLKKDDQVFINDGLVRLQVTAAHGNAVDCVVIAGGAVSNRKGVNLPGVDLPIAALTEKDREHVKVGMELGVDWVALSFVQRAEDVAELRSIVGNDVAIMAKIEKPNAVDRIDQIIEAADGIMVARGDLGVEMPLEEVPPIQKRLIRKCREAGKPVIVATQMLESMTVSAAPTRAEVTDVANATFEGADALMLSAESASGKYPVEAVQVMNRVITRVETSSAWRPLMDARHPDTVPQVGDAISAAAAKMADDLNVTAIVTLTSSGSTALRMSRQRPLQPIITLTTDARISRRLRLGWGLHTYVARDPKSFDDMLPVVRETLKGEGLFKPGCRILIIAGVPFGVTGTTNMIRVETL